jgi:hypothetical protein
VLVEQREAAVESRLDLENSMNRGIRAFHELTADTDSHLDEVRRDAYRRLVAKVNGV